MVLDTWVCLNVVSPLSISHVFSGCCPILFSLFFCASRAPSLPVLSTHGKSEFRLSLSSFLCTYLILIHSLWTYFRVGSRDAFKNAPVFWLKPIRVESRSPQILESAVAWIWQCTVTLPSANVSFKLQSITGLILLLKPPPLNSTQEICFPSVCMWAKFSTKRQHMILTIPRF